MALFSLILPLVCIAEIRPGDTEEEVRFQKGNPKGEVRAAGVHVLIYPEGEIELDQGRVIGVNLLKPSDFRRMEKDKERQRLAREQQAEDEQQAVKQQAERQRESILNDPDYADFSQDKLIRVWSEFEAQFPNEQTPEEYREARLAQEEFAKQKQIEAEVRKALAATTEEPAPRLSGSKSKKTQRAAGQVKPEDRPSFMTRQTLFSSDP